MRPRSYLETKGRLLPCYHLFSERLLERETLISKNSVYHCWVYSLIFFTVVFTPAVGRAADCCLLENQRYCRLTNAYKTCNHRNQHY